MRHPYIMAYFNRPQQSGLSRAQMIRLAIALVVAAFMLYVAISTAGMREQVNSFLSTTTATQTARAQERINFINGTPVPTITLPGNTRTP